MTDDWIYGLEALMKDREKLWKDVTAWMEEYRWKAVLNIFGDVEEYCHPNGTRLKAVDAEKYWQQRDAYVYGPPEF